MWKNRIRIAKVLIPLLLLAVVVGFLGMKWLEISNIIDEMATSKIVKKSTPMEPAIEPAIEPERGEIRVGFVNGDTIPTKAPLGNWDYTGGFAFDYCSRSVGLDLGRITSIKGIKLISSNASPTRLSKKDMAIFYSQDNQDFIEYRQDYYYQDLLTDPEHKGVRVLVFSGLDITGRYIKVHQKYDDVKFTFLNSTLGRIIGPLYDDYPVQTKSKIISLPTNVTHVQPKQTEDAARPLPAKKVVQPEKTSQPQEASQPKKVEVSQANIKEIRVGYCDQDAAPLNQPIEHWGYESGFAFDYALRSIGIDLGTEKKGVRQIKIIGWNANPTRLKESDISIYLSQDNRRFVKYTGKSRFTDSLEMDILKEVRVITLSDLSCQARYIKIHQAYRDINFTFANNLHKIIKVDFLSGPVKTEDGALSDLSSNKAGMKGDTVPSGLSSDETEIKIGYCDQDAAPQNQPIGHWGHKGGFAFDYGLRSIGIDLGKDRQIKKIKLKAWNDKATRLKKENLSIYLSQDNSNFTPYTGDWRFSEQLEVLAEKKMRVLILEVSCQTRFIKIHQGYADAEFTFANNLLRMVEEVE